jgi:hypothetical protein
METLLPGKLYTAHHKKLGEKVRIPFGISADEKTIDDLISLTAKDVFMFIKHAQLNDVTAYQCLFKDKIGYLVGEEFQFSEVNTHGK